MSPWIRTFSLVTLLCCAAGALAGGAGSAELIITARNAPLFPILTDEPPVDNPRIAFERELRERRDANPGAYLVDAGRHLSLSHTLESSYNYRAHRFLFGELDYDAVALAPRDALVGLTSTSGYNFHFDPNGEKDRLFSNLRHVSATEETSPAALSRAREREGSLPVTFTSLFDTASAAGFGDQLPQILEAPAESIERHINSAREAGALVAAVTDVPAAGREGRTGEALPDLWISHLHEGDQPIREAGVWTVRAPRGGEVAQIVLRRSEDGEIAEPQAAYERLFTEEQWAALTKYPVPQLGFPIPNMDRVARLYFTGAGEDRIQEDNLPADPEEFSHLTTREMVSVYRMEQDGRPLRIYRVMNRIPFYAFDMELTDPGWPLVDMLVVVDDEHQLDRVINRLGFPIGGQRSTLLEAVNLLAGEDPALWEPDPELAAGIEELWHWIVTDIRRAMEMDRRFFGDVGTLIE